MVNPEELDLHLVANQFVEQQLGREKLKKELRFEEQIAISDFGLRAANGLCTLVIGQFPGSGKNNYARSPGPRLFEAGITGSCQLVHSSEIPDMPEALKMPTLSTISPEQLVKLTTPGQNRPWSISSHRISYGWQNQRTTPPRSTCSDVVESLKQCEQTGHFDRTCTKTQSAFYISWTNKPGYQHGGAGFCLDQIVAAAQMM